MNHQLCVLLYSKYSHTSKQLGDAIRTAPVNLMSAVGLTMVCVDNEDIRAKIQTATSVEVTSVPTILIVYNNGGVEKYEGEQAFLWVRQTVGRLAPPPQPPPPPPPPPPRPSPPPTQVSKEEEGDDSDEEVAPVTIKRRNKKSKRSKSTRIENLDTESDEDDGMPRPPPVGVRSGAGGYEISKEFAKTPEINRDMSTRTDAGSRGTSLMARAQAMQKEREVSGKPQAHA